MIFLNDEELTTLTGKNSIDELKKAAQADFNRRVLENLTHGVTDET